MTEKTNPDGTRAVRFANPRFRVKPQRGVTAVGDRVYGAPGGSPTSSPTIFSYRLADELARELGTDNDTAHRCIAALGRAAQRILLRGQPVGIPHVGTISVREARRIVTGYVNSKQIEMGFVRYIGLNVPRALRAFIRDNAVYTGRLQDHLHEEREHLRRRLPKVARKGKLWLKHRDIRP